GSSGVLQLPGRDAPGRDDRIAPVIELDPLREELRAEPVPIALGPVDPELLVLHDQADLRARAGQPPSLTIDPSRSTRRAGRRAARRLVTAPSPLTIASVEAVLAATQLCAATVTVRQRPPAGRPTSTPRGSQISRRRASKRKLCQPGTRLGRSRIGWPAGGKRSKSRS